MVHVLYEFYVHKFSNTQKTDPHFVTNNFALILKKWYIIEYYGNNDVITAKNGSNKYIY